MEQLTKRNFGRSRLHQRVVIHCDLETFSRALFRARKISSHSIPLITDQAAEGADVSATYSLNPVSSKIKTSRSAYTSIHFVRHGKTPILSRPFNRCITRQIGARLGVESE